jgi:hypothetical protein
MLTVRERLIAAVVLVLIGAIAYAATSEPYVEYEISNFLSPDTVVENHLTVGIATPPVFDGLVFDSAVLGSFYIASESFVYNVGIRFQGFYGNLDTFIKAGFTLDTSVGFSPFLGFKLSIPLFAGWIDAGGQ